MLAVNSLFCADVLFC